MLWWRNVNRILPRITSEQPALSRSGDAPNRAMEQDLLEKSLPDGKTAIPVAGYLYSSKPSTKSKSGAWELICTLRSGQSGAQPQRE